MFDELIKSFKATIYERMSSPFLSSLILFFVYFNWKAVLVIFLGSEPIAQRIKEIESTYTNTDSNFIYPLVFALTFSAVYPFVSLLFFGIQNYAVVLKRKLRDHIEKNTTIAVDKYLEIKTEILKQKDAFNELLQTKDDEVRKLDARIEQLSVSE